MSFEEEKVSVVEPWFRKGRFKVYISHDGDEKYCLCEVRPKSGEVEYHVVSMPLEYHSMIMDAYERLLGPEYQIDAMGGGILTIDREKKTLRTYGQSGGYGPPRLEFLRRVLEETMGDYSLDIKVSDYIRG